MNRITAKNITGITAGENAANPAWMEAEAQKHLETLPAEKRAEFEDIKNNLPKGMKLAAVRYCPATAAANKAALNEFTETVQPAFYRYIARDENLAQLKAMGFEKPAIEAMKLGFPPVDEAGRVVLADIDHIMERGGTPHLTETKATDPALAKLLESEGQEAPETHRINHFENLYLLPRAVHEVKNRLNNLQIAKRDPNDTTPLHVFMLVPDGANENEAIYKPQGQYAYTSRGENPETEFKCSSYGMLCDAQRAAQVIRLGKGDMHKKFSYAAAGTINITEEACRRVEKHLEHMAAICKQQKGENRLGGSTWKNLLKELHRNYETTSQGFREACTSLGEKGIKILENVTENLDLINTLSGKNLADAKQNTNMIAC